MRPAGGHGQRRVIRLGSPHELKSEIGTRRRCRWRVCSGADGAEFAGLRGSEL